MRLRAGTWACACVADRGVSVTGLAAAGRDVGASAVSGAGFGLGVTAGAGCGARAATGAAGKGRGVASTGAAGATGATRGPGWGAGRGCGADGIGAVSRFGEAFACGARRCGTSEPPNMLLDAADGRGAAGAAGRGAGFGASAALGVTGGVRPVPRGRGPAMKVVWGGRPHWTWRRAKGTDLSSASDIRAPAPGGAHHEKVGRAPNCGASSAVS